MDEKTCGHWKLGIVKKTALDGKAWWVILGVYARFPNDDSRKYYFGKHRTRKLARIALASLDPDKTLHSVWKVK